MYLFTIINALFPQMKPPANSKQTRNLFSLGETVDKEWTDNTIYTNHNRVIIIIINALLFKGFKFSKKEPLWRHLLNEETSPLEWWFCEQCGSFVYFLNDRMRTRWWCPCANNDSCQVPHLAARKLQTHQCGTRFPHPQSYRRGDTVDS